MSPQPGTDDPRTGAPSPADNPTTPQRPAVGRSIGGRDRPADGRTEPARPTAGAPPASDVEPGRGRIGPGHTRVGGMWIGVILGAVVLIFLLVFVLQNLQPARVSFLGLEGTLPLGVWLLFAAVAGVLLLAVPGLGRLVQWRRAGRTAGAERAGRAESAALRGTAAARRPRGGRGRR